MTATRGVFAIIMLGAAVIAVGGCGSDEKGPARGKSKKPSLVRVAPAQKGSVAEILEATGEVVATNIVTVQATTEGPISYCPWREGDRVERAGQKLVGIDRPLYIQEVKVTEAALAVAQAKLADLKAGARPEEVAQAKESVKYLDECTSFSRSDLDRIGRLVKSGSISGEAAEKARVTFIKCQTQLASAKQRLSMLEAGPTKTEIAVQEALVQQAAARLAVTKAKLEECTIHAPFAGTITRVYVRPGDLATVRAPLLQMMETSSLVIRFTVPELQAPFIRKGVSASVRLDAHPGQVLEARIVRVYPQLDPATRTQTVEAVLAVPPKIVPGMFARVSVSVRSVAGAVLVPDSAILITPAGDKVAYVVSNGKAARRKIKTGIEQGHRVQVLAGIQAGELVVVAGNERLKDGMQVRTDKGKPGAAASKSPGDVTP